MYIVDSYAVAVILCVITMLCWGSWANTQKLASKEWAFPLFYWDYSIGVVLLALIFGFTFGSTGDAGRPFLDDLSQASNSALVSAFLGGVVFNLANLLVVAAIDIAGMSVAFPLAIGIALVLGVIVNYMAESTGNPYLLFLGVALVTVAIVLNAIAYRKKSDQKQTTSTKGIIISIIGGIIMGFFYRFVAASMSFDFANPEAGLMTPYSAVFVFAIGILITNFLWNTIFMYKPLYGKPVTFSDYFKQGNFKLHMIGILGGLIWNTGMSFSLIAAEQAGPAISYGLGQGATMVGVLWGVFIWKEFKGASALVNRLLGAMFILFIAGLLLIIAARM